MDQNPCCVGCMFVRTNLTFGPQKWWRFVENNVWKRHLCGIFGTCWNCMGKWRQVLDFFVHSRTIFESLDIFESEDCLDGFWRFGHFWNVKIILDNFWKVKILWHFWKVRLYFFFFKHEILWVSKIFLWSEDFKKTFGHLGNMLAEWSGRETHGRPEQWVTGLIPGWLDR